MKASELIQGVVDDARNLDREIYQPRSSTWHSPTGVLECEVCFAGVYLTRTLNPNQEFSLWLSPTQEQLAICNFLDSVRVGVFAGIARHAYQARLEDYQHIEDTLRHIHRMDPTLELLSRPDVKVANFRGWDRFDAFLKYAETLAGLMKKMGC